MMGPAVQVTPAATLPVSIEDLRAFCRVEGPEEDDLLLRFARSATAQLDGYGGRLGRALLHSTWRQAFCGFPHPSEPKMRLKLPNVDSAKIIAVNADGQEGEPVTDGVAISSDFVGWYVLLDRRQRWPASRGFVEYVAGYGAAAENVPEPIREAICLMVQSAWKLTGDEANLRNETTDNLGSRGFFGPEIMRNATVAHVKDLLAPYRWRPA